MKSILLIAITCFVSTLAASAQSPCAGVVMPAGTQCISQATANQAAEDHRVRAAVEAENAVLKQSLTEKDKTIAENKATALQNEADLKAAMHRTELDLATKTGTLIGCESNVVDLKATNQTLIQNYKARNRVGLIVF